MTEIKKGQNDEKYYIDNMMIIYDIDYESDTSINHNKEIWCNHGYN